MGLSVFWTQVWFDNAQREESLAFLTILWCEAGLTAAILVILRLEGLRLTVPGLAEDQRRPWQFSLRILFAWMTATAPGVGRDHPPDVVQPLDELGLPLFLRDQDRGTFRLRGSSCCGWVPQAVLTLSMACDSLAGRNPTAGENVVENRDGLEGLVLASVAVAGLWSAAGNWWLPLLDLDILVGSLAVFRLAGYRLVWRTAGPSKSPGEFRGNPTS